MVPHGFILKESEATDVVQVLIYLKGIWYVILNLIGFWILVGKTLFGKHIKMHELDVVPVG